MASDVIRIQKLIDTGIYSARNIQCPFFEASIVFGVVCMSDLLQKLSNDGSRVIFRDDIPLPEGKDTFDVTDLISTCRNAACHADTERKAIEGNRFDFFCLAGSDTANLPDGRVLQADYDDDVAVFWGQNRLYLQRHFIRAFDEATKKLDGYKIASMMLKS